MSVVAFLLGSGSVLNIIVPVKYENSSKTGIKKTNQIKQTKKKCSCFSHSLEDGHVALRRISGYQNNLGI